MAAPAQNPFIKNLAANERATREAALASLRTYLSSRNNLTQLEHLQIWRGLFYSMWHSDRPRPQQALASSLASLVSEFADPGAALKFQKAFWATMSQNWDRIDVLRMDKFLLLVRRYVEAGMKWAVKEGREKEWVFMMGEDGLAPLEPKEKKVPTGLRLHVLDVWVDELEKVPAVGEKEMEERREVLLGPVEKVAKEGAQKFWRKRAEEALMDDRVRIWRGEIEASEKKDDGEKAASDDESDDE